MNKGIYIIHRSEIIREGLAAIIRRAMLGEIFQLEVSKSYNPDMNFSEDNIMIFADTTEADSLKSLNTGKSPKNIRLIGIQDQGSKTNSQLLPFEQLIDQWESSSAIRSIVSQFFNLDKFRQEVSEGQELTGRERDVLKLVAMGLANKTIADQLFISTHTVISHRKNITEKLGIKSVSGLTIYAILNNIVDSENFDLQAFV